LNFNNNSSWRNATGPRRFGRRDEMAVTFKIEPSVYGKKSHNLSSFELGEDTHLIGNSSDDLSKLLALRNRLDRSGQGR
jgi:hypothetical protein